MQLASPGGRKQTRQWAREAARNLVRSLAGGQRPADAGNAIRALLDPGEQADRAFSP